MQRIVLSPINEPGSDDYIVDLPCDCLDEDCDHQDLARAMRAHRRENREEKARIRAMERHGAITQLDRKIGRRLLREKRDDAKRDNARARKAERRMSQGYRGANY